MTESIENNNKIPRVTMDEWRELTASADKFTAWLENNSDLVIKETISEDGRAGRFAQVYIDGELKWIATDDMGTIVDDTNGSIDFWGLTE